jgi:3-hydroxyacyl-CoA dehydrogenase
VAASNGFNVTIVEVNNDVLEKSKAGIKKNLERVGAKKFKEDKVAHSKFVTDTFNRIDGTSDLTHAVKSTDIVIEAIIENIKIKHELFSTIDKIAPEHVIFASNTSSLPITEIASVTNRKDRFGGLHFFNPVPVMRLVEVIRIDETSDDTYNKLMKFGADLKKTCVTCKDTPGFIVNRLLVPYMAEAVRMLERGDASARDIDTAMKLGAGYPMGPFELTDYVGLDTTNHIINGWHEKYPDNPLFKPSKLIAEKVKAGKLGVKSGEGFYTYQKK